MHTKVFRFLLKLKTITILISKDCFGFVPDLIDYSQPWNDQSVCEKLKITDEEFAYIESVIRDWNEIKSKNID